MHSPRTANTCSNGCSTTVPNACLTRTDGRTDGHKNSAYSHLDRYRFLTADRRETTGNGVGSGA